MERKLYLGNHICLFFIVTHLPRDNKGRAKIALQAQLNRTKIDNESPYHIPFAASDRQWEFGIDPCLRETSESEGNNGLKLKLKFSTISLNFC